MTNRDPHPFNGYSEQEFCNECGDDRDHPRHNWYKCGECEEKGKQIIVPMGYKCPYEDKHE